MDTSGVIQLIILAFLLLLSAFFSSAETALTTVNKVRVHSLSEDNNRKAKTVEKILNNYNKMLSTVLIGNNVVNIVASAIATALTIRVWGNYAIGIATGILTIVVLLFGEILPKTWAMINSEKISYVYAPIILLLMTLLTPVIFIVNKLSSWILRILHVNSAIKLSSMTERELKTYVDASHEDGVIETEEREMIYNVFDFSDAVAKDIMIPRIAMTTVDINATYDELLDTFRSSMYTRIPVYLDDPDNIIGIVNIKDLLIVEKENFKIENIKREAYYTYEFKKTPDLLMEMRKKSMNLAIVINEYAACVGMITLEDLLEEIVGEIRDEFDEDEDDFIVECGEREYLVEGSMKLDDINDAINTSFESEDYDSIGGLIIEHLDRLPEKGESVEMENGTILFVESIVQNRIKKVKITLPEPIVDTSDITEEKSAE